MRYENQKGVNAVALALSPAARLDTGFNYPHILTKD
jgi:hypothetical protein